VFAFGGRKADEEQADEARRDVQRFFKKQVPETLFAAVGNGVDDGEVEVYYNNYVGAVNWEKPGKGSVEVITRGSGVHAKRIIGRNNGQLVIKNSIFKIEKDSPYKGSGFEFFVNQVAALQKMGVTKIYTHAAGKPNDPDGFNGYYTWPRLGYDGTIPRKIHEQLPEEFRQKLGESRSVFDLFSLPGGKEWWNKNGADIVDAFFDLTPGSRNLERLEKYQAERRAKGTTGSKALEDPSTSESAPPAPTTTERPPEPAVEAQRQPPKHEQPPPVRGSTSVDKQPPTIQHPKVAPPPARQPRPSPQETTQQSPVRQEVAPKQQQPQPTEEVAPARQSPAPAPKTPTPPVYDGSAQGESQE
jgi:hypothetical protein